MESLVLLSLPAFLARADHAYMNALIVFIVMNGMVELSVETAGKMVEYRLDE